MPCCFRYLSDLHAPGDPAWQCIGAQHRWILQLMHGCREGCVRDLKGKALPWSLNMLWGHLAEEGLMLPMPVPVPPCPPQPPP